MGSDLWDPIISIWRAVIAPRVVMVIRGDDLQAQSTLFVRNVRRRQVRGGYDYIPYGIPQCTINLTGSGDGVS